MPDIKQKLRNTDKILQKDAYTYLQVLVPDETLREKIKKAYRRNRWFTKMIWTCLVILAMLVAVYAVVEHFINHMGLTADGSDILPELRGWAAGIIVAALLLIGIFLLPRLERRVNRMWYRYLFWYAYQPEEGRKNGAVWHGFPEAADKKARKQALRAVKNKTKIAQEACCRAINSRANAVWWKMLYSDWKNDNLSAVLYQEPFSPTSSEMALVRGMIRAGMTDEEILIAYMYDRKTVSGIRKLMAECSSAEIKEM